MRARKRSPRRLRARGYARVAPPILQPAEPFLDLSGEDIRKRMYLTTDAGRRANSACVPI